MYAIVEDSGTQIKVSEGDILEIDRRDAEKGSTLTFDRVLAIGSGDAVATIGRPYIEGATVEAEVLDEHLTTKIDVIKFKRRKGYRRKQGHRQRMFNVRIGAILATPKKKTTKKTAAKTATKTATKTDEA